ncbi:hypothetical protein [Bacillus sp. D386]|uniref:hypothetical protein n=1 Tax=Bacillus sp. D386 TaxID=2587155 RepID=UPI001120A372|nr:hypothetical protein [Bacillus sp. D386]
MNIKLTAEVYRVGISIGIFSVQEIIKWADNAIKTLENPPYEIIDLSLSSKLNIEEFMLKLELIKGDVEQGLPPKIILGLLNDYLYIQQDINDVITIMDKLIQHLPEDCEWMEMEIHYLSDGVYLAKNEIDGDLKEMTCEIKQFLNQFVDFSNCFGKCDF